MSDLFISTMLFYHIQLKIANFKRLKEEGTLRANNEVVSRHLSNVIV